MWHDSTLFQDSFFAPDNRLEAFGNSEQGAFPGPAGSRTGTPSLSDMIEEASGHAIEPDVDIDIDDGGGVVVDDPDSHRNPQR